MSRKPKVEVSAYINHGCTIGPYLNQSRISLLPLKYGPGSLNRILREAVQSFVDCAEDQQSVFALLQQGDGKVIITANFEGKKQTCRLPPIDEVETFWNFLESLFEDLMCCENFYTSQPLESGCTKCASKLPIRRESEDSLSQPKISILRKRRWSSDSSENSTGIDVLPMKSNKQLKPILPPESEDDVSSVVEVEKYLKKPNEWSVDDVIHQITTLGKSVHSYTELFKYHQIDGKAFGLLNSDIMRTYMGVKLGPALKIDDLIQKLNQVINRKKKAVSLL